MSLLFYILNAVSFAVIVFGFIRFFGLRGRSTRKLLALTVCTVISIILVLLSIRSSTANYSGSPLFIEAMQTFSLDADYSYLVSLAPDEGTAVFWLFKAYRVLLFSVAPVIGGAVIYDVLAGLSPELRMFFSGKKNLLVFSQLNTESVTLAENMLKNMDTDSRKAVVFTGCSDVDDELLLRAESIRGICLRDSIYDSRRFSKSGYSMFFLMNMENSGEFDDLANILAMRRLTDTPSVPWNSRNGAEIICFANSNEAAENIRAINSAYVKLGSPGGASLHLVRDNSQTACTLLKEHPLYEALGSSPEAGKPLRVLIIGNNRFSREMFSSVFWCGQVLDHPLHISLAYTPKGIKCDEPEAAKWLNSLNPEIIESCTPGSNCLAVDFNGKSSPEYASIGFIEEDVRNIDITGLLSKERPFYSGSGDAVPLYMYDYFIVMDGDDRANAAIADSLRRALQYLSESSCRQKIIAVAVEDDSFAEILEIKYSALKDGSSAPEMFTFGNLSNRFAWSTVSADGYYSGTENLVFSKEGLRHSLPDVPSTIDALYNDRSRIARDFHLSYKMFSAGCGPVYADTEPEDTLSKKLCYFERIEQYEVLRNNLSWLEHRRWCAFLRTQGFRQPQELYHVLLAVKEGHPEELNDSQLLTCSYKNTSALLHPCLVECSAAPDDSDMLSFVAQLRELEDTRRGISNSSKAYSMKKADAPGGNNAPSLTRSEAYYFLADKRMSFETKTANKEWAALCERFPSLCDCNDPVHQGRYCLCEVLKAASGQN